MRIMKANLSTLKHDTRGATAVEFALIFPTFLVLLLGSFDVGYQLYARAILQGAVQKAARDSGLQTGAGQIAQIDAKVLASIDAIVKAAPGRTVVFTRRSYMNLSDVGEMEDFTDSDADGVCDLGEPYEDINGSGTWNDRGTAGQGGARAAVLYSVTLKYDRMFPLSKLIGLPPVVDMVASTVLRNQPYDSIIGTIKPTPLNCTPADL
jgi:Flp pilus assembly protein TadG